MLTKAKIETIGLLVNPAAGNNTAARAAALTRGRLADYGVKVIYKQGLTPAETRAYAHDLLHNVGVDALVVCGGDGLINIALQEQANTGIPMGIIPAGTGNDHGFAYGVPMNISAAVDAIVAGYYVRSDIGKISTATDNSRFFGTIAAIGFDSLVNDRANAMNWPEGQNKYRAAIIRELIKFHPLPAIVRLYSPDGNVDIIEEPITLAAIGNTRTYGGGIPVLPVADPTDGLLDITIVGNLSRTEFLMKLPKVMKGNILSEPRVDTFRASKVQIEIPGINAYSDGEKMGPTPAVVECLPGAGCFIVGPNYPLYQA